MRVQPPLHLQSPCPYRTLFCNGRLRKNKTFNRSPLSQICKHVRVKSLFFRDTCQSVGKIICQTFTPGILKKTFNGGAEVAKSPLLYHSYYNLKLMITINVYGLYICYILDLPSSYALFPLSALQALLFH